MRFFRYSAIIVILLLASLPLMAQEETPPPPIPAPITNEQAQAILQEAQLANKEAQEATDLALNLLGLFEATSGAVGIILGVIVPLVAVIAGLFGFSRLASAQNELKEAREKFETDMIERQKTIDDYFDTFNKNTEDLRNAVQKRSANANLALSMLLLAERQYKTQDYVGAINTYKRALELDSTNPITHYRLGYVYTQKGDLDDAQIHIERALALDSNFLQAVAALGYVYRRKGDKLDKLSDKQREEGLTSEADKTRQKRDILYNQSEAYFLKVLPDSPSLVDEDGESWWGALGGLYRRRGQYREAIEKYEAATRATKSSSYPFSNLAVLYLKTGERTKMVETFKRVERLAQAEAFADVDNYWAHADLITSRLAQGKFQDAWDVLDIALGIAPTDGDYPLELLLETLSDVQKLMPDYEAELEKVIVYIKEFLVKRQTAKASS